MARFLVCTDVPDSDGRFESIVTADIVHYDDTFVSFFLKQEDQPEAIAALVTARHLVSVILVDEQASLG